MRYCGDWAGFAKERFEATSTEATVALFIPGAGADQDPEPRGVDRTIAAIRAANLRARYKDRSMALTRESRS